MRQIEDATLPTFFEAVRIVALNQSSSATVERTFSQLNYMVRTIGPHAIEETIETRLLMRSNYGHDMDYDVDVDELVV